jgi:hypothetical protein
VRGPWQRASSNTGHGGLASVLEGFCLGNGVLWVGSGAVTVVGVVQEEERRRGGVLVDRGSLHKHGYRVETHENSEAHSNLIFSDFCLPGVRHNAHKKFKFEFLKIFTLGGQHIGQGFQNYFCSEEIGCFAEILFQI